MKRIAILISALCLALSVSAQPAQQGGRREGRPEGRFNREEMMSRIQSEHIAYLTAELSLTPEEAQVFWPVYNKAQKEQAEQHKTVRDAERELRSAVKDNKGDKEIKKALDNYNKAKAAQKDILAGYQEDFIKAIGVEKTAKLYIAEDSFRTKQINRLGQERGNAQARQQGNRPDKGKGDKERNNKKESKN